MATFAFLLAALLDPVQAALVLGIVLVYRGPLPVLAAAAAAAVASETIVVLAAFDYTWGELIVPRFVSALLQAAAICWLVGLVRSIRWGGQATPATPPVPGDTAGLGSLLAGTERQRLAPWHMRAYVWHRLQRLREK
jgi:hypothetical protein